MNEIESTETVEEDRSDVEFEIDRDTLFVENALLEKRTELARDRDVLFNAGERESNPDLEGGRGVEVRHVEGELADADGRRALAKIGEGEGAILDTEGVDRQVRKERSSFCAFRVSRICGLFVRDAGRANRTRVERTGIVHHEADIRLDQVELGDDSLAAKERNELHFHRGLVRGHERLRRKRGVIRDS